MKRTLYGVWSSEDLIEEFLIRTPKGTISPEFKKERRRRGVLYRFREPIDLPPNCDVDFRSKREAIGVEMKPIIEVEG